MANDNDRNRSTGGSDRESQDDRGMSAGSGLRSDQTASRDASSGSDRSGSDRSGSDRSGSSRSGSQSDDLRDESSSRQASQAGSQGSTHDRDR